MPNEFISPNWHVAFIHFPLGLLIIGVLIELFSFLWPRSSVRQAGRWMILIGALSSIPALTLGLYALRDVVAPGAVDLHQGWQEISQRSPWSERQWSLMNWHVITMSVATGLAVLGAIVWLAASDEMRGRLRLPAALVVLVGAGLMIVGAWHSGEAVYRYGTAVELTETAGSPNSAGELASLSLGATAPAGPGQRAGEQESVQQHEGARDHARAGAAGPAATPPTGSRVAHYIPPLQLHLLLAGITVAIAAGAIGLTFRRWSQPVLTGQRERIETRLGPELRPETPPQPIGAGEPPRPTAPLVVEGPGGVTAVYPARFWVIAAVTGALTALAGLWFTGDWKLEEGLEAVRERGQTQEGLRLFMHLVFGSSIFLLIVLLAIITRVTRRWKGVVIFFVILLLLAVVAQMWLGILMLFDSHHGPLTGFQT